MEQGILRVTALFPTMMNLSDVGSIASIVGLILTLVVFISLRRIRSEFLFKVRVPELQESLKAHASKVFEYHRDYETSKKDEINKELAIAEVNLKSLARKTLGELKTSTKKLQKQIEEFRRNGKVRSKDELYEIYIEMIKLSEEITNFRRDDQWR
ncbi:MAG: hypothetical protein QME81_08755 [bacterium]|nr:hypothetical protein [bacterium]